jgi:hypothetical protein
MLERRKKEEKRRREKKRETKEGREEKEPFFLSFSLFLSHAYHRLK